jgi:hypothetical protein
MTDALNTLVRSIFRKESLNDCSLEELQQMAKQHPYFAPIQVLLAKKLEASGQPEYTSQLQTASLYFNNPLWLDYLLNGVKTDMAAEEKPTHFEQPAAEPVAVAEAPLSVPEVEAEIPALNELVPPPVVEEIKTEVKPVTDEEMVLSFEPYHTVDYFASQGIKLVQEDKPVDKFGKQLKSFTEWLKAMKRLPQTEIAKNIDTASEQKVVQLADHSNTEGEVVTETMAEVWLKQGNKEKAIEVYNKLSLINPHKSAYFASLIEQLKNQVL